MELAAKTAALPKPDKLNSSIARTQAGRDGPAALRQDPDRRQSVGETDVVRPSEKAAGYVAAVAMATRDRAEPARDAALAACFYGAKAFLL